MDFQTQNIIDGFKKQIDNLTEEKKELIEILKVFKNRIEEKQKVLEEKNKIILEQDKTINQLAKYILRKNKKAN
jgi:hypothetical protein